MNMSHLPQNLSSLPLLRKFEFIELLPLFSSFFFAHRQPEHGIFYLPIYIQSWPIYLFASENCCKQTVAAHFFLSLFFVCFPWIFFNNKKTIQQMLQTHQDHINKIKSETLPTVYLSSQSEKAQNEKKKSVLLKIRAETEAGKGNDLLRSLSLTNNVYINIVRTFGSSPVLFDNVIVIFITRLIYSDKESRKYGVIVAMERCFSCCLS